MTVKQAFEMIGRVCAGVSLNLEGHKQLQTALAKIEPLINRSNQPPEEDCSNPVRDEVWP